MKQALRIIALVLASIATIIGLLVAGIVMIASMPYHFIRNRFQSEPPPKPFAGQLAKLAASATPPPHVFTFDAGWIDEPASYASLLSDIAAVADDSIENITVRQTGPEGKEIAVLSFHHAGRIHTWKLSCDSQYIDEKFFDLVPTLHLGKQGKQLYWVGEPGECVTGLPPELAERLRTQSGIPLSPWQPTA